MPPRTTNLSSSSKKRKTSQKNPPLLGDDREASTNDVFDGKIQVDLGVRKKSSVFTRKKNTLLEQYSGNDSDDTDVSRARIKNHTGRDSGKTAHKSKRKKLSFDENDQYKSEEDDDSDDKSINLRIVFGGKKHDMKQKQSENKNRVKKQSTLSSSEVELQHTQQTYDNDDPELQKWTSDHQFIQHKTAIVWHVPVPHWNFSVMKHASSQTFSSATAPSLPDDFVFHVHPVSLPIQRFHPPVQKHRRPALFRASLCMKTSDNLDSNVIGMTLNAIAQDLPKLANTATSDALSANTLLTLAPQLSLKRLESRMEMIFYKKVVQDWLPYLLMTAALEEVATDFLKKEHKKFIQEKHAAVSDSVVESKQTVLSSAPQYYRKAPMSSQYVLTNAAATDGANSDVKGIWNSRVAAPPVVFTPSQLISRIKQGCSLAWDHYNNTTQAQPVASQDDDCALLLRPGMTLGTSTSVTPTFTSSGDGGAIDTDQAQRRPQRSRRAPTRSNTNPASTAAYLTTAGQAGNILKFVDSNPMLLWNVIPGGRPALYLHHNLVDTMPVSEGPGSSMDQQQQLNRKSQASDYPLEHDNNDATNTHFIETDKASSLILAFGNQSEAMLLSNQKASYNETKEVDSENQLIVDKLSNHSEQINSSSPAVDMSAHTPATSCTEGKTHLQILKEREVDIRGMTLLPMNASTKTADSLNVEVAQVVNNDTHESEPKGESRPDFPVSSATEELPLFSLSPNTLITDIDPDQTILRENYSLCKTENGSLSASIANQYEFSGTESKAEENMNVDNKSEHRNPDLEVVNAAVTPNQKPVIKTDDCEGQISMDFNIQNTVHSDAIMAVNGANGREKLQDAMATKPEAELKMNVENEREHFNQNFEVVSASVAPCKEFTRHTSDREEEQVSLDVDVQNTERSGIILATAVGRDKPLGAMNSEMQVITGMVLEGENIDTSLSVNESSSNCGEVGKREHSKFLQGAVMREFGCGVEEDVNDKDLKSIDHCGHDDKKDNTKEFLESVKKSPQESLEVNLPISIPIVEDVKWSCEGGDKYFDDQYEEEDESTDFLVKSSYLKVKPYTLLEWFGCKTAKLLTLADVQVIFSSLLSPKVSKIEGNQHGTGILVSELLTEKDHKIWRILSENRTATSSLLQSNDACLVLQLATEHEDEQVDKWETNFFAKTRFMIQVLCNEADDCTHSRRNIDDTERIAAAEQLLKEQKVWDTWRFKGIHSGCTIWPSWIGAFEEWRSRALLHCPIDSAHEPNSVLGEQREQIIPIDHVAVSDDGGRRVRRRGGDSSGVYYGRQSNLTQKQLMDAILRLVSIKGFHTIKGLQSAVQDESSDPLRRIRIALGKLVWKRNQLARKNVDSDWTDNSVRDAFPLKSDLLSKIEKASDKKNVESLIEYIHMLHETELRLRKIILQCVIKIPFDVIATAADERHGSIESMDSTDFEDVTTIEWLKTGHALLNEIIYRPQSMPATDERSPCYFFKIIEFCPSIALSKDNEGLVLEKPVIGTAKEPVAVERRMRFRAVKLRNDVTQDKVASSATLLLTEAQVWAGIKAAKMVQELKQNATKNPLAGKVLTNVSLHPLESENKKASVLSCLIVGHNSVLDDTGRCIHRALFLPTRSSEQRDAIWGNLNITNGGPLQCVLSNDSTVYSIQQSEDHVSSPAFHECQDIVKFLQKHPKAKPFMNPVDPVVLNIPRYFDVIKFPMDISTLSRNLEKGVYSNVTLLQCDGADPTKQMLNGPFRNDVERIFDNAMLFNSPDTWIHQAAATVKKAVLKKIDQASIKNEVYARPRHGVYTDVDSDVDLDKHESGTDEEFLADLHEKSKRKRVSSNSLKEDASLRAIERAIRLQSIVNESAGFHGPFSNIDINTDAATFSISHEWSCRFKKPVGDTINHDEEVEEMVSLFRLFQDNEKCGVRRSTRSQIHEEGSFHVSDSLGTNIEYFTLDNITEGDKSYPTNRLELEIVREKRHEQHFAKLYQQNAGLLQAMIDNDQTQQIGKFADGSFPPYLGRVIQSTNTEVGLWEIRPQYALAAARWVIRGLIRSEHLAELEPLVIDAPLTSGVIIPNNVYYIDDKDPFEILGTKDLIRKKRTDQGAVESSDDEIEMSEYEKLRAERVSRNADRLKSLGLA